MTTPKLQNLVQAWRSSDKSNLFPLWATDRELELAESKLGIQLPSPLRELYRLCNGINLLNGNLRIFPLEETDHSLGLSSASEKLRSWNWPIPHEVLVFGNDDADEHFGIWLPKTHGEIFNHPILLIGEIFEPRCMAIEATGLFPFLLGWTAYYSLLYEAEGSILNALGLPEALRFSPDKMDDTAFASIRKWADPNLPDPNPDPYRRGYDAEELASIFNLP